MKSSKSMVSGGRPNRGWGLRAGQIDSPSYFGPARYLDDDRRFFMARPLGVLWLVPFSRTQDIAGFGVFTGDPSEAGRGWESGAEVFYRLCLTQGVRVMPDVQYSSRDDLGGDNARTRVWGLRAELEF